MVEEIWETVRFYNLRIFGRSNPNTCRAWGKVKWRVQPTAHRNFHDQLHCSCKGLHSQECEHSSPHFKAPFMDSFPNSGLAKSYGMATPHVPTNFCRIDLEKGLCGPWKWASVHWGKKFQGFRCSDVGLKEGQSHWVVTSSWSVGLFALWSGVWEEEGWR